MALDDRRLDQPNPPEARVLPRLQISTDWMPERDRVPFFREELAKVLSVAMTPLDERPPRHAMDYVTAGPIGFSKLEGSPTRYVRTRRHLQDSDNDFTFGYFTKGWETFTHNGHEMVLQTGGGYLINNGIELDASLPEGAHVTAVRIDHGALSALVRNPERSTGVVLAPSHPGMTLLKGYLEAFSVSQNTLTPALLQTFGLHVIDLVASVLGASRDGTAQAAAGGVRSARLREVLNAIATRACDPLFTVEAMAAQLAVTTRYVHRMLEETGGSFNQHLVEQRLRRAWSLLSDPSAGDLKVASVAYECGFHDLSHFNRAFRRRFGETPTAVRGASAAAVPGGGPPVSPLAASLAT